MKKPLLFTSLILLPFFCSCHQKIKKEYHIVPFLNYSRTFNDLNDTQLSAARTIGIKPITSRSEAESQIYKLKEVKTCQYYKIEELTSSVPFLVKKGARLLETIGVNFQDSLKKKNAPKYRLIVTSVLRTHNDIKKLRQKNGNSSLNSAHLFGTTFDVAYARYEKTDKKNEQEIPTDKLKAVLAEVLRDLRKDEKCYVRYEVKQGCFHITTRP